MEGKTRVLLKIPCWHEGEVRLYRVVERSHLLYMSTQDKPAQALEPVLDYGCTQWRSSSQRTAELYNSGVKLWRKEYLLDIEQQLAQARTAEKFTVRRVDGSVIHIKNPMFGVEKPIWYVLTYLGSTNEIMKVRNGTTHAKLQIHI